MVMKGAWNTLLLSIVAMVISLLIGLVAGLMRLAGLRVARVLSLVYIEFFRGVPMIVTILFTFFAFPILAGSILPFEIDEFTAMLISY